MKICGFQPVSFTLPRYEVFFAICTFSSSVYPESSMSSIRSRSAAGMVETVFAVATKNTFDKSKGISM